MRSLPFSQVLSFLFGVFSVFSFFPSPLFPANEIIPYYASIGAFVFAAQATKRKSLSFTELRLGFLFLVVVIIGVLFFEKKRVLIDAISVGVVFLALMVYRGFSKMELESFEAGLWSICVLALVLLILQTLFPVFIDLAYRYLTIRAGSAAHIRSYSGGAIGFAPEPSYMAAFLLGPYMYFHWVQPRKLLKPVAIAFAILLTGSLSGIILLILATFLLHYNFFLTKNRGIKYLFIAVACISALAYLNEKAIERILRLFAVASQEGISLTLFSSIDSSFGSNRLRTLIEPLSSLCCGTVLLGDYRTSYSLFSTLFFLTAPFHLVLFLALVARKNLNRYYFASLLLSVISGPILNWVVYVGLIYRDKFKVR